MMKTFATHFWRSYAELNVICALSELNAAILTVYASPHLDSCDFAGTSSKLQQCFQQKLCWQIEYGYKRGAGMMHIRRRS